MNLEDRNELANIEDGAYRSAAMRQWAEGGIVEVDNDAIVSIDDQLTGAWVAAWVWVPAESVDV